MEEGRANRAGSGPRRLGMDSLPSVQELEGWAWETAEETLPREDVCWRVCK